MKPFNLEEALAGKQVVTRNGKQVTQFHLFEANDSDFPLFAVVDGRVESFTKSGKITYMETHNKDLFMSSEKVTKWVNVYKNEYPTYTTYTTGNSLSDTKNEAESNIVGNCIATVPITFESKIMQNLRSYAFFLLGLIAGLAYSECVLKPVKKEQSKSLYNQWITLVFDCIDSCMLPDHFYKCYGLINNFDRWFRHDGRYKDSFENTLKSMWAYLDKRYRNVIEGNDLTIDELIN